MEYIVKKIDAIKLLLDEYNKEVFEYSWRKVIPIPLFYKPVKYTEIIVSLYGLAKTVDEINNEAGEKINHKYYYEVLLTIRSLSDVICFFMLYCQKRNKAKNGDESILLSKEEHQKLLNQYGELLRIYKEKRDKIIIN